MHCDKGTSECYAKATSVLIEAGYISCCFRSYHIVNWFPLWPNGTDMASTLVAPHCHNVSYVA